jgi:hypothetical protein
MAINRRLPQAIQPALACASTPYPALGARRRRVGVMGVHPIPTWTRSHNPPVFDTADLARSGRRAVRPSPQPVRTVAAIPSSRGIRRSSTRVSRPVVSMSCRTARVALLAGSAHPSAAACTTMTVTAWVTTSRSSRAIRTRSAAAARRACSSRPASRRRLDGACGPHERRSASGRGGACGRNPRPKTRRKTNAQVTTVGPEGIEPSTRGLKGRGHGVREDPPTSVLAGQAAMT